MLQRILSSQENLLRYHVNPQIFRQIDYPKRHAGINSIKIMGEAKDQVPIMVLHGFGSGLGLFFPILSPLAASKRTIYLIDWLGFGGSDRPKLPGLFPSRKLQSAEFFTASLKAWMDEEEISNCLMISHSLGGLLSVRFSEKYPGYINQLVLASPAGLGHGRSDFFLKKSIRAALIDGLWTLDFTPQKIVRLVGEARGRNMVRDIIHRRFGNRVSWNLNLVADYIYEVSSANPSGEYALNALLAPPFSNGGIIARNPIPQTLPIPVHTIFGDRDWLATKSGIEHANKLGKLSILQNSGHHLYFDNPNEFVNLCFSK